MFVEGYQINLGVDTILNHIQDAMIEQIIRKFRYLFFYISGKYHYYFHHSTWKTINIWGFKYFPLA